MTLGFQNPALSREQFFALQHLYHTASIIPQNLLLSWNSSCFQAQKKSAFLVFIQCCSFHTQSFSFRSGNFIFLQKLQGLSGVGSQLSFRCCSALRTIMVSEFLHLCSL